MEDKVAIRVKSGISESGLLKSFVERVNSQTFGGLLKLIETYLDSEGITHHNDSSYDRFRLKNGHEFCKR